VTKGLPLKHINLKHGFSIVAGRLPDFFLKRKMMAIIDKYLGKISVIYPSLDIKRYVFQKI